MIRSTRSILSGVLGCLAAIAWPALGRAQPAPDAEHKAETPALAVKAPAVNAPAEKPAAVKPTRRPSLYFRAGGAIVKPLSSSRELELADVNGPASLAVHNGPIAGSGATVGSATIFAGIIGWVLPTASRRWSLEGVVGLPFTVKFQATGTLANMSIAPDALGIPTGVGPLGPELGEATAAPGVVTAVVQLTDRGVLDGVLWPYVGGGAAVLLALDPKVTNPTLTAVSKPDMTISPAPGIVLQGGLDVRLWKSVYVRLDVKFIALMMARAEVHHVGGLARFVAAKVPSVAVVGHSGYDLIFGPAGSTLSAEASPKDSLPKDNGAWRVWTSPAAPFRVAIAPDGALRIIERSARARDDERVLEPLSVDKHRDIARDFLKKQPTLAESLSPTITEDPGWWKSWDATVERLDAKATWLDFREGARLRLLHTELAIGLDEAAATSAANEIYASRALYLRKSTSFAVQPAPPGDDDLRTLITKALQALGDDELRRIWLPVGAMVDSMRNKRT